MKIAKAQLPKVVLAAIQAAFPQFHGRKYAIETRGQFYFDVDAEGGTFSRWAAVDLATGKVALNTVLWPWDPKAMKYVTIPEGFAVLEWAYFCGKDCGITVHYAAQTALPAGERVKALEKF